MNIKTLNVCGINEAIIGMRDPMNSWSLSDSIPKSLCESNEDYIGERDLNLAQRLIKSGTEHIS